MASGHIDEALTITNHHLRTGRVANPNNRKRLRDWVDGHGSRVGKCRINRKFEFVQQCLFRPGPVGLLGSEAGWSAELSDAIEKGPQQDRAGGRNRS